MLIHFSNPPSVTELESVEGVTKAEYLTDRQARVYFSGDPDISERMVTTSVQRGWRLREINLDKSALDEIFKQLSNKNSK
jgi:ABC-2 type transport system ATP-binding protein